MISTETAATVLFVYTLALVVTLAPVFWRLADLRRELKDTRDELRRAQGDLYQHQEQYSRAMRMLGLVWDTGYPPGWRKP